MSKMVIPVTAFSAPFTPGSYREVHPSSGASVIECITHKRLQKTHWEGTYLFPPYTEPRGATIGSETVQKLPSATSFVTKYKSDNTDFFVDVNLSVKGADEAVYAMQTI